MINGVKTNKNQKTMNTEEKEFPDFIENENTNDVAKNNDSNARAYAKILTGNPCGNWGAKSLHLKNLSSDKKIGVTIRIDWVYQNNPQTKSRPYILYPQQQIELGCPIPGPTAQRFDYSIAAAWFE